MKKFLTLFVFILTTSSCFSIQEEKKITIDEAINLAIKANPQLKLAHLDTDIARNNIISSNRLQNPDIVFFQNIPKAGLGNPQTIGADYTIEILKRNKRKQTAKIHMQKAHDSEKFLEYSLICDVKKAYIDFLVKKSHLKIIKEQELLSRELFETMDKEVKNGVLPETEAIQAKIVLNQAMMYSNAAKSAVITAQNQFNSVLNSSTTNYDTKEDVLSIDYEKFLAISPESEIPDFEMVKNFAILNRYDLQVAKKEVEAAKLALNEVKSQKIPDLSIQGGYAYQTKGMSENGHFQSGGYIGASLVNIPILYSFKPEIQNAEIEIKKAELKYQDLEIDTIRTVTDAFEKFVIARDNLNFYNQKLLIDSKELMESSRKSLDDKKIDLTSFLVSKRLYLELMLGYQETLGEYYVSYFELLKEINSKNLKFENI